MKRLGLLLDPSSRQAASAVEARGLLQKLAPLRLDGIKRMSVPQGKTPSASALRKVLGRTVQEVFWISIGKLSRSRQSEVIPLFVETLKAQHPSVDFHFIPNIKI